MTLHRRRQPTCSAPTGTRLPITPKLKIDGTARYSVPIGAAKAYVQGLVAHQSSASSDIRGREGRGARPARSAYTTGNLAIGAELDRLTRSSCSPQNLWDERAQITRFQQCGACDQRPYIVPLTPRTIGIRAGAKF